MRAFRAIFSNFRIRSMKLALYPWIANLIFSLIAFVALDYLLSLTIRDYLAVQDIPPYSFLSYVVEVVRWSGTGVPVLLSVFLGLFLLFSVFSIFISGGIYGILINDERSSLQNIFSLGIVNFSKMLKVFLVNILNWVVSLVLCALFGLIFYLIRESSGKESLVQVFFYAWIALCVIVLIFSTAIYDFSRIIRLRDERNFFYSFKKGIAAAFSNKLNVLFFFLSLLVAFLLLHLLLSVILTQLGGVLPFFMIIVIYQVFIWLKYTMKIIVMGAEVQILVPPPTAESDIPTADPLPIEG